MKKRQTAASDKDIIVLHKVNEQELESNYLQHYFMHVLCIKGKAQFRIRNTLHHIKQYDISIWLPAAEITGLQFSRDFKATWLFVSFNLMSKNNPDIGWGIKGFLFSQANPVVHLSEKDFEKCLEQFHLLKEKYANTSHHFHKEIVNLQLQIFIMEMWNIFSKEIANRNISNQKVSLFEKFLQLLQQHCMEKREVEYYAAQLFITPKYLTEVCKKNSNKTAMEWIENYTMQRLIILLQNSQLSFTQIADTLHFSSQSFFSRYVKKVLGVSPGEYRNRMAADKRTERTSRGFAGVPINQDVDKANK